MAKLFQNLQDASTTGNFKSPPCVKDSSTSFTGHAHGQFHRRFRDGDRVHWRSPALKVDKHGVDSIYVPYVSSSKQTKIAEVLPHFKRWQPMEEVRQPEELNYLPLQSCEKCLPMSKLHLSAGASATLQGLDDTLIVPSFCRSWLSPIQFLKHSIYLTCKSVPHNNVPIPKEILSSEGVEDAISRAIEDDPETDRAEHRKRAASIFERMRASISTSLLRVAVWFMDRIMSRMLTGVYVPKGQIDMIKRASEQNIPMVYLPLHRSHLDYVLVTYLLYLHGIRVPLVAAGDNLLIPIFGQLLRGLGGFFIKRRLDFKDGRKDHVYRAVLKEYMKEILKAKHSLEFFLEGGRSRTGKTCLPKAGLLSVIVDSLSEEPEDDVFIVPISISYEKLLDGSFVDEQMGEPKVMETFTATLTSIWRILHSNYGAVRIDFCQPFSLREFLNSARLSYSAPLYYDCPLSLLGPAKDYESPVEHSKECSSANALASAHSLPEDTQAAIKSLANHVVYQSTASLALMSTNLVAFLLLTKHRKGGTLQQLAESLCWLRSAASQRDHQVMCPGESAETVRHAIALLGKELVISETVQIKWSSGDTENSNVKIAFYRPALQLPAVLELQYYANAVLPVFVHEAIVVTALYALTGDHIAFMYGREIPLVSRCDLLSKCQDLINLLQHEFVLVLPCSSVEAVISDAILNLVRENILNSCQGPNQKQTPGATKKWPEAVLQALAWEDESGETPSSNIIEEQYRLVLDHKNLVMLEFFRSVLASYIESYWVVACTLLKLVGTQMEESLFFRQIQKVAQDKLQKGTLYYEESFAADTLRNAVQLYEQWGIVEHHTQDGMRVLYLKERWNVDEAIDSVISFVGVFKQ